MRPWEHVEVKKVLRHLIEVRSEKRVLRTPEGFEEFTVTIYRDKDGVEYVELRSSSYYLLTPKNVLEKIIGDLEKKIKSAS